MPAPIKLHEVPSLTVRNCTVAPNQARTLTAEHAVKVDGAGILAEGDAVEFEDADLGYIFRGKIISVEGNYEAGEGVTYQCADSYRTLPKTPAKRPFLAFFSSKIKIAKGTALNTAIGDVLATVSGEFPGGIVNTLAAGPVTPPLEKGGQTVDTWLDDLLDLTTGGIAYCEPNGGSPRLRIEDFYAAPAVSLVQGAYNVVSPTPGQLLLNSGKFGKSLNKKYQKYTMEGAGRFTRHVDKWLPATLEFADHSFGIYRWNWYLPEAAISGKYLLPDGTCAEGLRMKLRIGGNSASAVERIIDNPPFSRDSNGRVFFWAYAFMAGVTFTGTWIPPQVEAWFTYTSYDGPLEVSVSSADPKLAGEGELVEQHCSYMKYTAPDLTVDPMAELTALANAAYQRYSGVDLAGALAVHIKGLHPNLKLGSPVTNFGGARVRLIEYDLVARSMTLQVSSVPLRENVSTAKLAQMLGTLPRNSWFAGREEQGCFCGELETLLLGTGLADSDFKMGKPPINPGQPQGGPLGGGGNDLPWDCQWGTPVNVGKGGRYKTEEDCKRAGCDGLKRWTYVKCAGCMQVDGYGLTYLDEASCLSAHPGPPCNDADCKYNCDPGVGCVCAENGTYNSRAECEAACVPPSTPGGSDGGVGGRGEGSGVGEDSPPNPAPPGPRTIGCCENGHLEDQVPVLTCIKIDAHGRVIDYTCDLAAAPFMGVSQTITRQYVCEVYCDEADLVVKTRTESETKVNGVTTEFTQSECEE